LSEPGGVGIDLLTIEARVAVASIATYLQHSEALSQATFAPTSVSAASQVAASRV
jgi:hypothetical protein